MDLKLPKKRSMMEKAHPWKRILSFIVDLLIINIFIMGPFSGIMQGLLPQGNFMENYNYLSNSDIINELYVVMIIIFVLMYLYFVVFEHQLRQTPGKMLFNLYLVPLKKKDQVGLLNILARNLAVFPVFPFSLLWIIDPVYLVISGKRLSDIFSKTIYAEEITV